MSKIGQLAAWLNLALVLVILLQVVLRYFFHHALVPLEELMWHLYATAFMAGLSYGLLTDQHVRVDIFHQRFSPRIKAGVEIFGLLFLVLPFVAILLDHSIDWVALSWRLGESSESASGLPYRWLIKSVIPLSMGLLGLVALTRLMRQIDLFWHGKP